MLISISIDDKLYHFQEEISILEACNSIGIKLPRFCYHENLAIAGNCRMCLVELEKSLKPIIACSTDISNGMNIFTKSPLVLKARENILEFLLLNHPLDCPICDQGGECDLQDQAIFFGSHFGRNFLFKRSVEDKNCSTLIKTVMNRCIHCTRCVRFGEEICGFKFFGTLNRGVKTEIGGYLLQLTVSEISANVIDLCPVGALTLKSIPFQARSWELFSLESIDLTDCIGSNIYLLYKGSDILKVVPKKNTLINDFWISNKARFYFNTTSLKYVSKTFLNYCKLPSLFLFNADQDLKTLFLLKYKYLTFEGFNPRVLNSTSLKTNFFFWGLKSKIFNISTIIKGLCFLLSSNLQQEASILNIKLRYKVVSNNILGYSFGHFKSNFPIKFLKFSILEIVLLLLGKHFFLSNFFFKFNLLFFSNKSILDRLDLYFFNILNYKVPQNLFFNISSFCNTEGLNYLNFKKFNLKEYFLSKHIFGLCLDDTFLLRKLFFYNKNFFWINQYPSNLLSFFIDNIWISLDINQSPGFYLNIEQRVQKMSLLQFSFKFTLLNFLKNFNFTVNIFKNLKFSSFILSCQFSILKFGYLVESFLNPRYFNNLHFMFIFNKNLFFFSYYYYYKLQPVKNLLEDPYRTSINLKFSIPLIKSSQTYRQSFII